MEYVWSIFGLRRELLQTYTQSKNALFLSKTARKRHEKSHTVKEFAWECGSS